MSIDITSEITFRKLSIFMTFMEKGNIARTAEALGLSGVSVHRALHTLEENVRCPLFTHKGRNLIALPKLIALGLWDEDDEPLRGKGQILQLHVYELGAAKGAGEAKEQQGPVPQGNDIAFVEAVGQQIDGFQQNG